jgi:hypothetical protein
MPGDLEDTEPADMNAGCLALSLAGNERLFGVRRAPAIVGGSSARSHSVMGHRRFKDAISADMRAAPIGWLAADYALKDHSGSAREPWRLVSVSQSSRSGLERRGP